MSFEVREDHFPFAADRRSDRDLQLLVRQSANAFKTVEASLATTSFARALPRLVFADELFGSRNVFLLRFVFFLAPLHALGTQFEIPRVPGGVVLNAAE
ncbi:MAG: hypothetical protein R2839_02295 [Thermomicrobiales bacterium]